MPIMTWLHVSDLHVTGRETAADRMRFDAMLDDIQRRCAEDGLKPDAVFFTGDIVFSGQGPEYQAAHSYLDDLLAACGLPGQRDRLFIVPGNHDIDRAAVNRADYTKLFQSTLVNKLLETGGCKEIDDFLSSKPNDDKNLAFEKMHSFSTFTKGYFPQESHKFDPDKIFMLSNIEKEAMNVVVLGLNSVWSSYQDDEQGRLILGEVQICNAIAEAKKRWPRSCLTIALVHHPLYWLAEKDLHRVHNHIAENCDLLLRGHLHCPSFSVQRTPDSMLQEFAAGASLSNAYHAYNLVRLDLETGRGNARVRLHHPDIGKNWGDDTFTYRNIVEGRIAFALKPNEKKEVLARKKSEA